MKEKKPLSMTPEAIRKRKERAAKDAADKAAALKLQMDAAETPDQFWAISIKTFDPEKIAAWKARQEEVFDKLFWIDEQVKGTYDADPNDETEYVSIEEGNAGLQVDLEKHTQVDCHGILSLGQFWRNTSRMSTRYIDESPNSVFARTGLVIGIPSHWLERWREFYQGYRLRKAKESAPKIKCATCQMSADHLDPSTIQAYSKSGTPYRCDNCPVREESLLLDDYGRVKDQ